MWRTHLLEKTPMLERLRTEGEGDNREWDGYMASLTQWKWVWVNLGSWWWTGRSGMLQSMGSQRVGHDWATELNWTGRIKAGFPNGPTSLPWTFQKLMLKSHLKRKIGQSTYDSSSRLCHLQELGSLDSAASLLWFYCWSQPLYLTSTRICCCPGTKSCPALCSPRNCSTSDVPVLHHLPELYTYMSLFSSTQFYIKI